MQSIKDYLSKTESATKKLFEGIEGYLTILRNVETPVFVGNYSDEETARKEYEQWAQENEKLIQTHIKAQNDYVDEIFAQSTLCGAILQIAAMAIKKFSKNTDIPAALNHIPRIELAKKYCVGRFVNDVPLGLIIYAGRNQFNHLDAQELFEPSKTIFTRIGQIGPSRFVKEPYQDPAFDLNNRTIINFASNITALIGWRNYNTFENDMIEMLEKY